MLHLLISGIRNFISAVLSILFLPEIIGRFLVGATTFTVPIRTPRLVGSARLRKTRQPALKFQEVTFTAYYPTDPDVTGSAKRGLDWLLRPLNVSSRGFAQFLNVPLFVVWPLVYLFGSLIKIPVYPNAPLLHPRKANTLPEVQNGFISNQWPLVIFSHGLGGSRTAYSQLCSRIAASGKVVLALEHRDGTGYAAVGIAGTQVEHIPYNRSDDVVLDETTKATTPMPFRTDQLEFRRQEIYTAYDAFSQFIRNDPSAELMTDIADLGSWRQVDQHCGDGLVRCFEQVTLIGHSFGGCTMLSMLSTNAPAGYSAIPVTNVLVLDPWLEPLPTPGSLPLYRIQNNIRQASAVQSTSDITPIDVEAKRSEPLKCDDSLPRLLVVNSEAFTLWEDHFARLQDMIKAWEPQARRIITFVNSQHTDFSDFRVLPLLGVKATRIFMDSICRLSIAFIDGNLEQALASTPTKDMEIKIIGKKKDGQLKRKLAGKAGDIVVT